MSTDELKERAVNHRWTAVVPLRAGSKGLPAKNIRQLAGRPLYMHTVEQALGAGAQTVVISTNIPEVLESRFDPRVCVLRRPEELCTDSAPMDAVLEHAITCGEITGVMVLLQATSPLRTVAHISEAIREFVATDCDLLLSVTKTDNNILKYGILHGRQFEPVSVPEYCFMNRQALPDVYRPNGSIYVACAERVSRDGTLAAARMSALIMSEEFSVDIDDEDDFFRCESILGQREIGGQL